jgi:hypothetical protein
MNEDVVLIIDTNSNYSDVWNPCFARLEKYAPGIKKYAFTDTNKGIPDDITPVIYDNDESYRNQFLSCIKQVKEKYIIYTSEDYILYDHIQQPIIEEISRILDETEYSFCKFIKGPEKTSHLKENIYIIDPSDPNFFAQQASIWDTRDFEKIFETAPSENTRMEHEPQGSDICRQLGFNGLQYFSNTAKRGVFHYDSEIYPCIATAVVKGLWNLGEYPTEMAEVIREFKIDCRIRGWC